MRVLTDDEVTQIILEQGPLTAEELARMAYPVRVVYLALMLSWAKEHGLDNLVEHRKSLKPVVQHGLAETAEFMNIFWERQTRTKPGSVRAQKNAPQVKCRPAMAVLVRRKGRSELRRHVREIPERKGSGGISRRAAV